MIPETSKALAKMLLEFYAAPYYAATPARQERVIEEAAQDIEKCVKELIVKLSTE